MRLLRVELTRLRWRRAIVVLLVACVAVPLVLLAGYAWDTRPFSDADIARGRGDEIGQLLFERAQRGGRAGHGRLGERHQQPAQNRR